MRAFFVSFLALLVIGSAAALAWMYKSQRNESFFKDKMHMAEAMMNTRDHTGAMEHLKPVVEAGSAFEEAPRALYLYAKALEETGSKEAFLHWQRLTDEYPGSGYYHEALVKQAETLFETDIEKARAIYGELSESADPAVRGEGLIGVAKCLELEGRTDDARALYLRILDEGAEFGAVAHAKDRLTEMHHAMLWSPALDEFSQLYTVERGDAPIVIGQKFKTTAWYVLEANNIRGALRPGKRLKVPKEPYKIIVDKKNCRLNLMTESNKFIKWYKVGVGEQSYKTPAGEYKIENKQIDPVWYRPSGGIIQPGDPENALGTRWMGIGHSLGIHGTNEPDTIGYHKSAGCIRMYNEQAEELYKIVTLGAPVIIMEGDPHVTGALRQANEAAPAEAQDIQSATETESGAAAAAAAAGEETDTGRAS